MFSISSETLATVFHEHREKIITLGLAFTAISVLCLSQKTTPPEKRNSVKRHRSQTPSVVVGKEQPTVLNPLADPPTARGRGRSSRVSQNRSRASQDRRSPSGENTQNTIPHASQLQEQRSPPPRNPLSEVPAKPLTVKALEKHNKENQVTTSEEKCKHYSVEHPTDPSIVATQGTEVVSQGLPSLSLNDIHKHHHSAPASSPDGNKEAGAPRKKVTARPSSVREHHTQECQTNVQWFTVQRATQTDFNQPRLSIPPPERDNISFSDLGFSPIGKSESLSSPKTPRNGPSETVPVSLLKECARIGSSLLKEIEEDPADVARWMSLYAFVKQLDNSLLKKVAFYMNLKRDIFLLPTADSDSEDLFLQLKGEVVALLTVQETKVGQKHFSLLPDDELSLEEGGSVLMEAARDVWRGEDRVKSKFNHLRVYSDDDELDTAVSPVEQVANLIHSYMSCTEGRRKKTVDTKALCDKQTEAKAEEQKTPENLNQLTKNVSEQAAQLMKRIVAVQASTNFSSVRHQEEFASFACDFLEISAAAQRILDQSIIEELTTPEKNPPTTTKVLQNVSYSLSPTRLNHSLSPKVPGRPPNQYRRSISLTQAATSASESQQTSFQRSATQQHYGAADPSSDPPQKDVFERLYPAPRSPGESPKLPVKTAKPTFRLYV